MLRTLVLASLASFALLTPTLVTAQTANFRIEEATIEDIQGAILRGELTSTRLVQLYLNRIKAYNGTCVNQPDGVLGTITPIKNAHQVQGNESRLTAQRSQDLQQVLRVPRGALAASLDGSFVGDLAYQIEREVANHGHVLGAVAGA